MPKIDRATGKPVDPWDGIDTMMRVLAIDPGDAHVGMAEFEEGRCVQAWEENPAQSLYYAQSMMREYRIDALVIESFELYPWKAQQQAFSQLRTCQLIGAFKLLFVSNGTMEITGQHPPFLWYQQKATIKKPIAAKLKARGIPLLADESGSGGHARDAEWHGYHFLFNNPQEKESNIDAL